VKILVAGVGNIFFGDDGFGPAVARALASDPPPQTKIEDYGIRGLHLAYELVSGYDRAFLIDAVPRGGPPGTLYLIEPGAPPREVAPDAHRMDLENVLAFVRLLGGEAPPITLVGCEPLEIEDAIGLSPPVREQVEPAAELVRRLVTETLAANDSGGKVSAEWLEA
jgi:hydrogenase maturation protease